MTHIDSVIRGQEFEDTFHRLLGRLVMATCRLDFNVGLQLNWHGSYYQRDVSEYLNPFQTQLKGRLTKLKHLLLEVYEPAGENALAEFKEWFKRVDECRSLRNDYVHGRWGVPGAYKHVGEGRQVDAIPLLTFIPLNWNMDPDQSDISVELSIEEFAAQVEAAESLVGDYVKLTDRYIRSAKASQNSFDTVKNDY